MSQIAITTPQNVKITFKLATLAQRMIAFFLDASLILAYIITMEKVVKIILIRSLLLNELDNWSINGIIVLISLPVVFYALASESLLGGQSFGKKLMKIKVVKIDGYQAGFGDYLIRWIFRSFEIWIFFGIPALVANILSKNSQRLGDMATGTTVVSLKNNVNISNTILEELATDYIPTFPQVIAFSDDDVRIIKENFQKALGANDQLIISKLTAKIEEISKIEYNSKKFTQRQFISTIIKDYNFYTRKES